MAGHTLEVLDDAEAVARRGAELIAESARAATAARGEFMMAASGGHTPWAMYGQLEEQELPWTATELFQADERIAPAGSPDRNLTHLIAAFSIGAQGSLRPMPVDDGEAGAQRYSSQLPDALDLVHLGLGPDGHTASLVPGDPVLDVTDRRVAVTGGTYQGTHRMTLTYPALAAAERMLWIVTGDAKREPLAKLLAMDDSIPAGRVEPGGESLILADREAAPQG
ncbi:6-phosphogluconolactonase [soil metagenome]